MILEKLCYEWKAVKFPKYKEIFQEGDLIDYIYFIKKGEIEVSPSNIHI